MEHVIQFAVGVDDDRIQKLAEEYASKKVVDDIEKDIRERIYERSYSRYGNQERSFTGYMDGIIYDWLEKNKLAIIDKTSALLADKLARTKIVKEAMAEIIEKSK